MFGMFDGGQMNRVPQNQGLPIQQSTARPQGRPRPLNGMMGYGTPSGAAAPTPPPVGSFSPVPNMAMAALGRPTNRAPRPPFQNNNTGVVPPRMTVPGAVQFNQNLPLIRALSMPSAHPALPTGPVTTPQVPSRPPSYGFGLRRPTFG